MTAGLSITADGLRRRFRTGFALEVDSLTVPAGHSLAILGPSGSGKSTLLSMLGLLEQPDAGRVLLDGRPVSARDRAARLSMAAVFQRPYLIKGSVADNVAYGLALRGVATTLRRARVDAALERVGLQSFGERSASHLSGGEAQRVALARALVLQPKVLLLDEPLASLDPLLKRRLVADFAGILREEGVTVIYVTHDHDEALVIADEIAVMNAGRIASHGPARDVLALPADEWTAEFLGVELPGRGVVVSSDEGLVHVICGTGSTIVAAATIAPGTEVMLSVPPEDVLIAPANADLGPLSARNRLDGIVDRVEPRGSLWRAVIGVDGLSLASHVSSAALRDLSLAAGQRVQVVFKATAVRIAPVS